MKEERVYCDICKKQINKKIVKARENKHIKISIYGGLTNGRVFENSYDICDKCLDKLEKQLNITKGDYQV